MDRDLRRFKVGPFFLVCLEAKMNPKTTFPYISYIHGSTRLNKRFIFIYDTWEYDKF